MQRQTLPHTSVWHGKESSHWVERHSPAEHSPISRARISLGSSPHQLHSSSPGHMGRSDSAFQLVDGTSWSRLLGTCGLSVPCSIHPEHGPDAALHRRGCCCSRSLRAVGGSMHCKGCQHCSQFQGHSFWFTFSTSLLRNLNCLFNPLGLGQKHSAVQPSTAGANLIPIETENLPGIKTHMGTI